MNNKGIWIIVLVLAGLLVGYAVVAYMYPKLPEVEVKEYNNTPANYRGGFGTKDILEDELPSAKFKRKYKYVVTSPEGKELDGAAYLKRFKADGDAVVKKRNTKGEEDLILFTDYQPDAFSRDFREQARSKWMRMVGRTLPADMN
jgi:hypothetical protein